MKNRQIIGIAGYSGSGKSTLARLIADRLSYSLLDVDLFAKDIMIKSSSIKKALIESFGQNILNGNDINFKVLGELAFRDWDSILRLNSVVHPILLEKLKIDIDKNESERIVVDAALISYWGIEGWFDSLYWIHLDKDIRIQRISERVKDLSLEELNRRFDIQESLFSEPSDKWRILENSLDIESLYSRFISLEENNE